MTEREQFEAWIKSPPFEHWCEKFDDNAGWPDHYKRYETQLAWEAWQAARDAGPSLPLVMRQPELLKWVEAMSEWSQTQYEDVVRVSYLAALFADKAINLTEVDALTSTERGASGFGSTGK